MWYNMGAITGLLLYDMASQILYNAFNYFIFGAFIYSLPYAKPRHKLLVNVDATLVYGNLKKRIEE